MSDKWVISHKKWVIPYLTPSGSKTSTQKKKKGREQNWWAGPRFVCCYEWGLSLRSQGVTHMFESCHMSRMWESCHACLSHVTHVGVMWHMWRRCMLSRMKIVIVLWRRASYAWVVSHMNESCLTCRCTMPLMWMSHATHVRVMSHMWMLYISCHIQPIADRVPQHLEMISKTFPTNQNSAHGIYD